MCDDRLSFSLDGRIVVREDSGYRIAGPFQNNRGFSDDYDFLELPVSEKTGWGDAAREAMCCIRAGGDEAGGGLRFGSEGEGVRGGTGGGWRMPRRG